MEFQSTSVKVPNQAPSVLTANGTANGPTSAGCLMQVAHDHPLKNSELNYHTNNFNIQMETLRNRDGLHAPLKIAMELHACKQVGRLPFLKSSNLHQNVLLGRDETIDFSDFLGGDDEYMRHPHAVAEKHYNIF